MNFVIVSEKSWNSQLLDRLDKQFPNDSWTLINKREDLTVDNLNQLHPDKVFVPHWSYIIPASIYNDFECIVFHMTDLPFGRGGSPLQNLIVRGYKETKVSALRVVNVLDGGDIYLKKSLPLYGTAEEIYMRANDVIEQMITEIVKNNLTPIPQQGKVVEFKRRKPAESNIAELDSIEQVYDYIRMLDAEGYPNAFLECGNFRLEFSRASLKADNSIVADVKIRLK